MELYSKVRLARADGMSQRDCALHFGVSRETIRKMDAHSLPPGYRRSKPIAKPKLDGFTDIIDAWLVADQSVHKKQRHTAKRVWERLRDEHQFTGGRTIVQDYIASVRRQTREMFVPLAHDPGHAQADFGHVDSVIGGVQRRLYFFCLHLPYSDACFVKAYEAATSEAWMDGHVAAFEFFGGVPLSMLYDNDRCLVSKILDDGTRLRSKLLTGCQSHYLFHDKYGRPGKGNDKGNVEGLVGYSRRNFMVPMPTYPSLADFNAHLERCCLKRQEDILRGHKVSIGERMLADLDAFKPLPATPFDACDQTHGQVSSQSLVRYKTNDYSVPVVYGHRQVWIRGYVDRVVIGCAAETIASHNRSYESGDYCFDPIHYLPLLERKIGALDQAAPLKDWDLPDSFATFRRLAESRMGKQGKREFVRVLRLIETFDLADVSAAVQSALGKGAIGYDAVKHLLLCRVERRPPRLDLDCYPYLPKANVATTKPANYSTLMSGAAA